MSFSEAIYDHLADYKRSVLGICGDVNFRYRGKDVPKSHILPYRKCKSNIIERYRSQFFASEYSRISFHRYFHHLNSSQALCINLFYPLIAENSLQLILRFLKISRASGLRACFEKKSELEIADRRTSFDFHISYSGSSEVFFEVKYTERDFGKAKDDEDHRTKFRKVYLPLLEQSAYLNKGCQDRSLFLGHYQILRNLVHLASNAHVVLLFPSANSGVARQASEAFDEFLTDAGRSRCRVIFLEEMVSYLEANSRTASLDDYFGQFRRKYLPPVAIKPTSAVSQSRS